MKNYFVCSVGEVGREYDQDNFERCIMGCGYYMHNNCTQTGNVADIKKGDVLLLKYKDRLFAYGIAESSKVVEDNSGWDIKVPVEGWFTGKNVSKYGIQEAQLEGSNYATVKKVEPQFAIAKMQKIGLVKSV